MQFALKIFEIIVGLGFAGGGIFVFFAAKKRAGEDSGKDQLIDNLKNDRDAWKSRFELEHSENMQYRDEVHENNKVANAKILNLSTENEQLKSRTDLSPLMDMMKTFIGEQTNINKRILDALTALLEKKKRKTAH